MEMTGKQRLMAFLAGATAGAVLTGAIFWHRGLPHRAALPEPGVERRLTPGALTQWTNNGQPIEGAFITSESLGPVAADGSRTRGVVVPGLDPGSYVRLEEQWAPGTPPVVRAWKFMFADRVRVKLKAGADTRAMAEALQAKGWRFAARDAASGWVTVALGTHLAGSVPAALKQMQAWPQWVVDAQPDLLPPPNGLQL